MLEVWTGSQAEFKVAFMMEDRVAIKSQLSQLGGIFQTQDIVKLFYSIVR